MTHLALIGNGRWGKNILRTLKDFPDVSVTVVNKGEGIPGDIKGVLIATPSATHAEVALPFIQKGIATFIEKPMATSIADAERIRNAALASGVPVFVGHIQLYNPLFLKAQELLPHLGKVRGILAEGANDTPRSDSSILWDWLPHHLSQACELLGGRPERVVAWGLGREGACESAVAKFSYGDAQLVSVMNWCSPKRREQLTVFGENGSIVLDDTGNKKLIVRDADGQIEYPEFDTEPPLARELRAYLETVRTHVSDRPHLEESIAITRAITAAGTSAHYEGKEQTITR